MPSDRRRFLRRAFDFGVSASLLSALRGLDAAVGGGRRHRGLKPVRDATSVLTFLRLPEGFRYFSFGWAGEALAGGGVIPAAADGMGLVATSGSRLTFIRNQEVVAVRGAFAAPESAFDPACGGGCVRLTVDLAAERLIEARPGLSGTRARRPALGCALGAEPTRGHSPGTIDQGGVVAQGLGAGATRFLRLEGCLVRSDGVWFTSTSGGDAGGGQVWRRAAARADVRGRRSRRYGLSRQHL